MQAHHARVSTLRSTVNNLAIAVIVLFYDNEQKYVKILSLNHSVCFCFGWNLKRYQFGY